MSKGDANHREFLEKLYDEHAPKMYRIALTYLRDHYLAEVVVQDTMIVAIEKVRQIISAEEPEKWLYGVLYRLIRNMNRAQNKNLKRIVSLDDCLPSDLQVMSEVSIGTLYKGIITDDELEILEKLYVRGDTYKELADEKGVSQSAIGMKAKRSREKFRKRYEN